MTKIGLKTLNGKKLVGVWTKTRTRPKKEFCFSSKRVPCVLSEAMLDQHAQKSCGKSDCLQSKKIRVDSQLVLNVLLSSDKIGRLKLRTWLSKIVFLQPIWLK